MFFGIFMICPSISFRINNDLSLMINKCQDRKKARVNFKHNKECMLSLKKTMLKLALFNVFNTENHIIHTYTQNIKRKKNYPHG